MKIDSLRNAAKEIFCDTSLNYNLILSPLIDPNNQATDLTHLSALISEYEAKHSPPDFKLDLPTYSLQKTAFINDLSNYVNRVSDTTLEKIGALICMFMGCDNIYCTKKSHDQGIDIIGEKSFDLFSSNKKSYIIGQSKNYGSILVDVRDVRELAGSILLLKHKEFSQKIIVYKAININSLTPVQGIFVTSYFFSDAAKKLCDTSDILPIDFIDIICILSHAATSKIDIKTNGGFGANKFDTILSGIKEIS